MRTQFMLRIGTQMLFDVHATMTLRAADSENGLVVGLVLGLVAGRHVLLGMPHLYGLERELGSAMPARRNAAFFQNLRHGDSP